MPSDHHDLEAVVLDSIIGRNATHTAPVPMMTSASEHSIR